MSNFSPMAFDNEGEYDYIQELIDKTPDYMLVREFTQNGIEAPGSGKRRIVWGREDDKLTVWNNGDPLTDEELDKLKKMASVGRKAKGKHGNKGIGARITGMSMSPGGLIYDTCDGKTVKRMTLVKKDGKYGGHDIEDVTADWDLADGGKWTNVMFVGAGATSKTMQNFWQGAPKNDMVGRALWDRYFRIPENVTIEIDPQLPSDSNRVGPTMVLIDDYYQKRAAEHEVVEMTNGVIVHYYHLPTWNASATRPGKHVSHAGFQKLSSGVVFCSDDSCETAEIFSHVYGRSQTSTFMQFGMEAVSEEVAIFVEVPKSIPVSMSDYRDTLNWDQIDHNRKVKRHRQRVKLQDFATEIRNGAPQWLVDLVNDKKRKRNANRLDRRLKEVAEQLKDLGVFQEAPKRKTDGDVDAEDTPGVQADGGLQDGPTDPDPDPGPSDVTTKPALIRRTAGSIKATIARLVKVGLPTEIVYEPYEILSGELERFPIQIMGQSVTDPDVRVVVNGRNRYLDAARETLRTEYGIDGVEAFDDKIGSELQAKFAFEWALVAGQALEGSWHAFEPLEEGEEDPINDVTSKAASSFMLNSMVEGLRVVTAEVKKEMQESDTKLSNASGF